jgi:tetratricopeptide (TPR) repeat protein
MERPPPEIARELGVTWILAADVQTAGGQVRVNARLVNARRDRQVWAEGYQRAFTAENIFAIQSEITKAIVAALELELTPDEERRVESVPTRNTAAYELYLQAKDLDTTRAVGGHDRKIKLYQRALELDSTFAEAWAGLADAYVERAWGSPRGGWADSGLAAARKALALDPELADAYAQLGDALWTLPGDSDEWLFAYRKALELQPSNREALNNLGTLLFYRGRQAEALKWIERGPRLSPTSPAPVRKLVFYNAELGRDAVANGWLEYGRARGHPLVDAELIVELFQRANVDRARELVEELSESEEDYVIHRRRGALALYEQDWGEARRHYRVLYPGVGRAAHPTFQGLLWDPLGLAFALDRLGYREEAREVAEEVVAANERELEAANQNFFTPWNRLAVARLILGDTTAALDLLEKAVEVGYRDVRTMRSIPTLIAVRDHPRFHALLGRMDLLVAEERRRAETEGWGEIR